MGLQAGQRVERLRASGARRFGQLIDPIGNDWYVRTDDGMTYIDSCANLRPAIDVADPAPTAGSLSAA